MSDHSTFAPWPPSPVEAELRAKLDRVEAAVAAIEAERDAIRAAYIGHNAGRAPDRPRKRPDLSTWGNAYEVAARAIRAALDGDQ